MKRLSFILLLFALFSCQDKVICPAFQSTYILDDSTRDAYFSYVWQLDEATRNQFLAAQKGGKTAAEDSNAIGQQPATDYYAYAGEKVVPWRVQKRTKFGIIKTTPRFIKNYQLRTAPMENVLGPEVVTNTFVAEDFSDSLSTDSLSIASDSLTTAVVASADTEEKKPKYLYRYDPADNFNAEQEYYNKYFGPRLIDNRPEPEPVAADSLANLPDSLKQEKVPFFKKLFGKKAKSDTTTTETAELPVVPSDDQGSAAPEGEGEGENEGNGG